VLRTTNRAADPEVPTPAADVVSPEADR
jgi:hypothetical protein